MNLRLPAETEAALRDESTRTGRSQQEIVRVAVMRYLDHQVDPRRSDLQSLIDAGLLIPARTPLRHPTHRLTLPDGVTSLDLLDREDRF
jgi:hypothetical protein